jgi:hypothetical protein
MSGNRNLMIGAVAAVALVAVIAAYFIMQGDETAAPQPAPQSTQQPAPPTTPESQPK